MAGGWRGLTLFQCCPPCLVRHLTYPLLLDICYLSISWSLSVYRTICWYVYLPIKLKWGDVEQNQRSHGNKVSLEYAKMRRTCRKMKFWLFVRSRKKCSLSWHIKSNLLTSWSVAKKKCVILCFPVFTATRALHWKWALRVRTLHSVVSTTERTFFHSAFYPLSPGFFCKLHRLLRGNISIAYCENGWECENFLMASDGLSISKKKVFVPHGSPHPATEKLPSLKWNFSWMS